MSSASRTRELWDRIRSQPYDITLTAFEERLLHIERVEREQSLRMIAPGLMNEMGHSLGLQSLLRGGRVYRTVDDLPGETALKELYDLEEDWEIDDTVTVQEYDGPDRPRYEATVTLRYEKSLPAKLSESDGNVQTVTDRIRYSWPAQH